MLSLLCNYTYILLHVYFTSSVCVYSVESGKKKKKLIIKQCMTRCVQTPCFPSITSPSCVQSEAWSRRRQPEERVKCTLRSDLSLPAQGTSVKTLDPKRRRQKTEKVARRRRRWRNQEVMWMPRRGSCRRPWLNDHGCRRRRRPFPWPRVTATLAARATWPLTFPATRCHWGLCGGGGGGGGAGGAADVTLDESSAFICVFIFRLFFLGCPPPAQRWAVFHPISGVSLTARGLNHPYPYNTNTFN